eukprot:1159491-Pelagomonas_calceolata.AAC.32
MAGHHIATGGLSEGLSTEQVKDWLFQRHFRRFRNLPCFCQSVLEKWSCTGARHVSKGLHHAAT